VQQAYGIVAVVLGTRPEIIKLAGVIRGLGSRCVLIHSGQHYHDSLSSAFFASFDLPEPTLRLADIGGAERPDQIAGVIEQVASALRRTRPGAVVVQGDTNTAAAGALAANFLGIPVVHVEAGLRSYDRAMAEEINRRLVGVVADLHCAPTESSADNLRSEGVTESAIRLTGNTVVEATIESLPDAAFSLASVLAHDLRPDRYVLATIHRPENTDDPAKLTTILEALGDLPIPVVLPLHPRTRGCVERFGLQRLLERLRVIQPIDHPAFLGLAAHARLLVSDSGGIQEECTILKRPLIVIRNSSERPESIAAGFALLVQPDERLATTLTEAVADAGWTARLAHRPSPFGDGHASERIVAAIDDLIGVSLVDPAQIGSD